MVDEYVAEAAGERAALLSALGKSATAAAVLAANIATYLPFPAASIAGELALVALGEQDMEQAAISIGMGLIPFGKLMGPAFKGVGRFIGEAGASAWKGAKHYARRGGTYLANRTKGLISTAKTWLRKACGCFEAGTEVWTSRGLIPIEQLCVGDEVFAQDEESGEMSLRKVTHTFVRKSAPIVAVTLMSMAAPAVAEIPGSAPPHATTSGLTTLNTTEEHPFLVEYRAATADAASSDASEWIQAGSLKPGDEVVTSTGEPAVVLSVRFTGQQATAYNLEVEGLHNYFVDKSGLVTHNSICEAYLGSKVLYAFGHATGNAHNILRSTDNAAQLAKIGIFDNAAGHEIFESHFKAVYLNPANVLRTEGARQVRESLIAGPRGLLKVESVWQGNHLITFKFLGGGLR